MIVRGKDAEEFVVGDGVKRKVLSRGGKLMAVEVSFKKGAVGQMHSHPHEQISYIVSGVFEVNIDGDRKVLSPSDSYYVPPNVLHGVVALEDSVILDIFTPQREDFL